MQHLNIIAVSAASVIVLFLLTKLMGKRQMSQLSMFDYIIGITIGSIAAEMATALEGDFTKPLIAMVVYALFALLFSWLPEKSLACRRLITGKARILLADGKIYRDNFKKAHLDLNEFLCQCRNAGYFSLDGVQTAVLEQNGKISFQPRAARRPVTPQDLGLSPEVEKPQATVIADGVILHENLKSTGNNELWLEKELRAQGISDPRRVFYAASDNKNTLSVYVRCDTPMPHDMFE